MATIERDTRPRSLLRISDLEPYEFGQLLDLAASMKARPRRWRKPLRTETLVCLFEKPSTRTRVSFAAAAQRLGMLPLLVRPDELQLGRGEPIADTARALSAYGAAIVLRTYAQERLDALAPYQVDDDLMAIAAEDAVFLHCLPAHRGEEVTASVIDGPASVVWQQAANRLPTEQALIYALVTGWWDGTR